MYQSIDRRRLLGVLGAGAAILVVPGCAGIGGALSLDEVVRRLLMRSADSAFALLLQPGGYYDSEVARITLPEQLGGSGVGALAGAILRSGPVRQELLRTANDAAYEGAQRAAPIVTDTIRSLSFQDANAIIRGGPTAATDLLQARLGVGLIEAMLPEIGGALQVLNDGAVSAALRGVTGFDFAAFRNDVGRKAAAGIYALMGQEEARIRRDPRSTRDPVLIGAFGL